MFRRELLNMLEPFHSFCSVPPPTQNSLFDTGMSMNPSTTPLGGLLFDRMAEQTRLKGDEPKSLIEVSGEHTPIYVPSRKNSFNTDFNDLTTTVAASEITNAMEVGLLASPLFSQEREVSANPFGVSGSQQQAAASILRCGKSLVNPWQSTDLWSSEKPVRCVESKTKC